MSRCFVAMILLNQWRHLQIQGLKFFYFRFQQGLPLISYWDKKVTVAHSNYPLPL